MDGYTECRLARFLCGEENLKVSEAIQLVRELGYEPLDPLRSRDPDGTLTVAPLDTRPNET